MTQVRTLANGHLLWDSEFIFILRQLRNLATNDPPTLKAIIKKCIYPEYNFSTLEILMLKQAKLIFESEHTVEKGIYTFDKVNNVILSELKKLHIDKIPELREVLKSYSGPAGLDTLIERLHLNLKGFSWTRDPSGDLVTIIADEINKLETKKAMRLIRKSDFPPVSNLMIAKMNDYLTEHKYHLLLLTIIISAGIYDHYHENYLGKLKNAIKTQLFSFWQTDAKENKDNFNDYGLSFVGPF